MRIYNKKYPDIYKFPEKWEIFFNFRAFLSKIGILKNTKKFNNFLVKRPRNLKIGIK